MQRKIQQFQLIVIFCLRQNVNLATAIIYYEKIQNLKDKLELSYSTERVMQDCVIDLIYFSTTGNAVNKRSVDNYVNLVILITNGAL